MRVEARDSFDQGDAPTAQNDGVKQIQEPPSAASSITSSVRVLCLTLSSDQIGAVEQSFQRLPLCDVVFLNTFDEARSRLAWRMTDVIVVLQSGPELIQFETISRLRTLCNRPVLAVLDQETDATVKAIFEAGAHDYLTLHNLQSSSLVLHTLQHLVHRYSGHATAGMQQAEATDQETIGFDQLAAGFPGVIFQCIQQPDGTCRLSYISPRCRDFGIDATLALQEISTLWAIVHPGDVRELQNKIAEVQQTPGELQAEFQVTSSEGTRWVQCSAVPSIGAEGDIVWEGFVLDCTNRKQAERLQQQYFLELQALRSRYESAELVSGQLLFEWDVLTNQPMWGPNTEQILGRTAAEMPESLDEWFNLIHPEDQKQLMQKSNAGSDPKSLPRLEYRVRRKDGSYVWVEDKTRMLLDTKAIPQRLLGFLGEVTSRKHHEIALQESEARFRFLSEGAPIGIFHTDSQGQSIYENACLRKMVGSNDLEDCGWFERIHPEDFDRITHSLAQLISAQSVWNAEFRLISADHQTLWVLGQAVPMSLESGRGYMGTITDITDQKRAESALQSMNEQLEQQVAQHTQDLQQANTKLRIENEVRQHHIQKHQQIEHAFLEAKDQLQAVLDAVPACVVWVGANLNYLGLNQRMAETVGDASKDLASQKVGSLPQPLAEIDIFIKQFFIVGQDSATRELEIFLDDRPRHYLAVAQRYHQGRAAVFVLLDISDRKQAELEIYESLERTQELSELKSRFISIASHEFRTPLTTIFSASELLEHYGERWTREKKLQYLKQIQSSVKHMTSLLDDVLLISAEEAGKLKFEPSQISIIDFCETLVEEFKLSHDFKHALTLTCTVETEQIQADRKLLRHILSNLLSNAVKYSPEHQPIEFNLTVNAEDAIFQICDCGIGIPVEDQQHLFELFHRAANVGTIAGTGLGLSIVSKAVALHGGTIDFKSELGAGTRFIVSLPVNQSRGEYQW